MNTIMKNNWIYILFIPILFFQCKTTQLEKFEKAVKKSTSIKFLNPQEFKKSRELMLSTFSPNVIESDSVIILEYFADGIHGYYCTIYESRDRICKMYSAVVSIKNGAICVDSLERSNVKDKILPMIINGDLDKVKKKGDKTTLTPAALLIINILTKEGDKPEFNVRTVITRNFLP